MAPTEQSPEMLEGIIEGLFPRHDPSSWPPFVGQLLTGVGDEERVTDVELAEIAKSFSVGKSQIRKGLEKVILNRMHIEGVVGE